MRNGSKNIYAYKMTPEGEHLWGENGLPLTDNRGSGFSGPNPASVTTAEHVTFIWEEDGQDGIPRMVMQKLTPDGQQVWGDDGLGVPGQELVSFLQGNIVSGGGEDLILVYGIENGHTQIMTIYAQKFDGDGNPLWNGGQAIKLHESVPFFINPQIVSDGAGGAYLAWHTADLKSFVQHLDTDGNLLMSEGGAPVSEPSPNLQIDPRLQFSPDVNELYIFWTETSEAQSSRGLSGNKMSPTGELLWEENGRNYVELARTDLNMVSPRLTGDDIVVFYAHGETADEQTILETRLKALLINSAGEPLWDEPLVLSSSLSEKRNLVVDAIGDQEWVAVWGDSPESGGNLAQEIMMQNLPLSSSSR